jgi:hypothetical protein
VLSIAVVRAVAAPRIPDAAARTCCDSKTNFGMESVAMAVIAPQVQAYEAKTPKTL